MKIGTLVDPLTLESTTARIPSWKPKEIYHIPISFKIQNRIEKSEKYPFLFQTKTDVYFMYVNEVERYAKKFDRMHVCFLTSFEYIEHLETFLENVKICK